MLRQLIKKECHYIGLEEFRNHVIRAIEQYYNDTSTYEETKAFISKMGIPLTALDKIASIKQTLNDPPIPITNQSQNFRRKLVWSPNEDNRLIAAAIKYNTTDWNLIASFVGAGRDAIQCIQRWNRQINPYIENSAWTKEEDMKLMSAVQIYGKTSWVSISKLFTGRSDNQCRLRYLHLTRMKKDSTTPHSTRSSENSDVETDIPKGRRPSITIAPNIFDTRVELQIF